MSSKYSVSNKQRIRYVSYCLDLDTCKFDYRKLQNLDMYQDDELVVMYYTPNEHLLVRVLFVSRNGDQLQIRMWECVPRKQ